MKSFVYVILFAVMFSSLTPMISGAKTDADTLAAYIEGGADSRGLSSMLAVGAVIMNRCLDERFPDSVIENGNSLSIMPSENVSGMARFAAELVISGKDVTKGAVFMFSEDDRESYEIHGERITFITDGLCFSLG